MKKLLFITSQIKKIIIISFLTANVIWAKTYYTPQVNVSYQHGSHCQETMSCDLKNFRLWVRDMKIVGGFGTNYSTKAYFSYTTDLIENLQNYGVVQFIRGCMWSSKKNNERYEWGRARSFFGKFVTFRHPKFVIDSVDTDPMYSSKTVTKPFQTRHDIWRWNKIKNSFNGKTEFRFYKKVPTHPTLYARDSLGTAFYSKDSKIAINVSLEFKTCIYKIDDIPVFASPDQMNPNDAIKCLKWNSSNIYDHRKGKFLKRDSISPICLKDH